MRAIEDGTNRNNIRSNVVDSQKTISKKRKKRKKEKEKRTTTTLLAHDKVSNQIYMKEHE